MPQVEPPKFKTVGGPKTYMRYTDCKPGQVLVTGKYIGRSHNKFGKENFDFEPLDGGQTVCLNHAGQLEKRMEENVEVGDIVRITFEGKAKIEKGDWAGKEANQFTVEVAEKDEPVQMEMPLNEGADAKKVDMSDLD